MFGAVSAVKTSVTFEAMTLVEAFRGNMLLIISRIVKRLIQFGVLFNFFFNFTEIEFILNDVTICNFEEFFLHSYSRSIAYF